MPKGSPQEAPVKFMEPPEAAALLKVSEEYLKKLRRHGTGPRFTTMGSSQIVRYRLDHLLQYAESMSAASSGRWPRNVEE